MADRQKVQDLVFSSITFLFYFLPLFFAAYFCAPGLRLKNAVLLIASLVFYAWGEPAFTLVLAAQIVFNWFAALMIDRREGAARRWTTGLAITLNLFALGIFKYADFVTGSFNALLGAHYGLPGLALPLGISFFTFHSVSYLVDVHRGQVKPNRSLTEIAVYIGMFPQLVAGPLIRYHTISHRLHERRTTLGRVSAGLRIFVIGLAQKVLIADEVARLSEAVFDKVPVPGLGEAWLGLCAYTIQIYFDFAGYSTMAIGLAIALGFIFPRNFNLPYTSRSITEFWRRWHMSLSQWLRDYLYIPLGGSRGSAFATMRNLWLVFLICGLWHGANWTFVIWGAHHGLFLVLERFGLGTFLARGPVVLARIYTLAVAMSGWVWFRAHDATHALTLFKSLVGLNGTETHAAVHLALSPIIIIALIAGAALALVDLKPLARRLRQRVGALSLAVADGLRMAAFFALSVVSVAAGSYSPFLYFRF